MIKLLSIAVMLAACGGGGDKCARVYDKMAPMFDKMGGGKKPDRDKMVGECKAKIKEHPDREAEMDCILAIDGELTMDKLLACDKKVSAENPGAKGGFKDYQDRSKATEAKLQLNKIGKLAKMAAAEKGSFPAGSAPGCERVEGGSVGRARVPDRRPAPVSLLVRGRGGREVVRRDRGRRSRLQRQDPDVHDQGLARRVGQP